MMVTPDSVRINIDNNPAKAVKGGFAIGSFDASKAIDPRGFMYLTPKSSLQGEFNTKLGYSAGKANKTGVHNVFIGHYSGLKNSTGSSNVMIGDSAGLNNISGTANIYIGYLAGLNNTTGQTNVAIGQAAGRHGSSYSWCTFLGQGAGVDNNGNRNTYLGAWSGSQNSTGTNNTFIGYGAGQKNNGSSNTMIGKSAGEGSLPYGGSGNVFIGYEVGKNISDLTENKLYIDNSSTVSPLLYGDFQSNVIRINGNLEYTGTLSHVSDANLKTNIVELENTIEKLKNIRGITFDWKPGVKEELITSPESQIGVIAQEVESVFPEIVSKNDKGYKMVDYSKFSPILIEAIKEQEQKIELQQQQIDDLRKLVEELQSIVAGNR